MPDDRRLLLFLTAPLPRTVVVPLVPRDAVPLVEACDPVPPRVPRDAVPRGVEGAPRAPRVPPRAP